MSDAIPTLRSPGSPISRTATVLLVSAALLGAPAYAESRAPQLLPDVQGFETEIILAQPFLTPDKYDLLDAEEYDPSNLVLDVDESIQFGVQLDRRPLENTSYIAEIEEGMILRAIITEEGRVRSVDPVVGARGFADMFFVRYVESFEFTPTKHVKYGFVPVRIHVRFLPERGRTVDNDAQRSVGPLVPGIDGVTEPVRIKIVEPEYPELGRQERVEGKVVLRAIIRADGTVTNFDVLKVPGNKLQGFAEAAVNAVSLWRYEPATLDGVPVDVWFTVVVNFSLEDDAESEAEGNHDGQAQKREHAGEEGQADAQQHDDLDGEILEEDE